MPNVISADRLAVNGGTPVRDRLTKPWPSWPVNTESEWKREIEPALREVYLEKTEGLPANRSDRFGNAFAAYCGARYGLMMPHGTDAISASIAGALDLDGLREGGEIIIPNYTFIATASAALSVRCRLALVDIDPVSFTLDPNAVQAAITDRTVGILPVHLGGHPADMDALNAIADKHGLAVVEDAAQAHGAEHNGRKVGPLGDVGAYSFQSSKNLTAGEGGCLVTDQAHIYERACAFRDVGRRPGGERWEYPRHGWNYRTSEYLACLLLVRLESLQLQTEVRSSNAAYLTGELRRIGGVTPPETRPWVTRHGFHLYMTRYDPEQFGGRSRDEFITALTAEGIDCTPGYRRPLTDEGALKSVSQEYPDTVRRLPCPNVEAVCRHSVWFYQSMLLGARDDLDDIVEAVDKIKHAFSR